MDMAVASGLLAPRLEIGIGVLDKLSESNGVQHSRTGHEQVERPSPLQVGTVVAGGQAGFQQSPQGTDVLLDEVADKGWCVAVPDQVDQFAGGDRSTRLGEQRYEQTGLSTREGAELDPGDRRGVLGGCHRLP